MASTYSALKIELIGTGDQAGVWGNTTNVNLGDGGSGLEQAIVGMATLVTGDFTSNSYTLPYTDTNALQDFRALVLNVTATLSANGEVIVPAIQKPYLVMNNSVGGYSVTFKVSGQTGVTVPSGYRCYVYNNGTDVIQASTFTPTFTANQIDILAQGDLRLQDASGGQYVAIQAPATIASNYTLTMPVDDGNANQALITDGSGVLSWASFGTGTVTAVSVASANGLAGTSSGGATPALTLSTTVTGLVKGNGTALSAAVAGTDYAAATTGTNAQLLANNGSGGFSNVTIGSGVSYAGGTLSATGSGGTVTTVSVVSANGLAGTVANATTTPAITLSTSVTGVLKGNGTAISAAVSGTDYAPATSGTNAQLLANNGTGGFSNVTVGSGLSYSGGSLTATGSGGTVTSVSVASANGFAGTVANPTTTPAITLSTSITGLIKGNGTAISAAVSGTDYAPATSGTSILYGNGSGGFSNVTVGTGLSFSTGTLSNSGVTGLTAGTGISLSGGTGAVTVTNSAPDQVVSIASGSGISVTGTYPSFTVAATGGSMVYPSGSGIAVVSSGTSWGTTLAAPSGTIVGTTDTQTLTNKRINLRVSSTASTSSLTVDSDTTDQAVITALAAGLTVNAPTGTPVNGQKLTIRIKDNGTARSIGWNAAFRAIGVTLPTTTVISKVVYIGCIYNSDETIWDVVSVAQQA